MTPPAKRARRSAEWKRWDRFDICSESADSNFLILPLNSRRPLEFSFHKRISSQLLYYRISVLFGMPSARRTDGYKSCWEVELRHIDGTSILRLYDSEGAAAVGFNGLDGSASNDGLELINFLVSLNCLHTNDGIRAGTVA